MHTFKSLSILTAASYLVFLSMGQCVNSRPFVLAPVSVMFHYLGVWILWYLDDWLLLASSRAKAFVGKGQGFGSLSPTWHCGKLRKIISQSDSDCDLPRDDDREPLSEHFSFPGEGFDPAFTDHRISVL